MNIAQEILTAFPELSEAQKKVIAHYLGPLLVIAGPGSGKTFSMVLRVLNLLLTGKATPREIIVCTFTEKAALELRDRISGAASKVQYSGDLAELRATTIHSLCNRLIIEYRHKTPLGNNFETLDELTQLLFLFDNFPEIVGEPSNGKYCGKWATKWSAVEGMKEFFNKMTEELVDPVAMEGSADPFLRLLSGSFQRYEELLYRQNRLDFAHLQKLLHQLLNDSDVCDDIRGGVKYLIVDEYQDTNFIQEQIVLRLISTTNNVCVVGDEDQSIYRFRGATVRNILEFPSHLPSCSTITLTTNYRSHETIIAAYDRWMAAADWSNPNGSTPFRYQKTIGPIPDEQYPQYPSVCKITGTSDIEEAELVADFIAFLKTHNIISDLNQVAILLHSVRTEHSGKFIDALAKKDIRTFCPRARRYFENEELAYMIASYALILGYYDKGRGSLVGRSLNELARYVDECVIKLAKRGQDCAEIFQFIQRSASEIANLATGAALDKRPADYLYQLLSLEPFKAMVKHENSARNLAVFSQLLTVFQSYYHYSVITFKNREILRHHFFNSFLRLLFEGGINEYEDADSPFPKNHVQILTIHQSKGLEFPVVIVGSLHVTMGSGKSIDSQLAPYFHRPAFEPERRITEFDRMRLHYVAFSRAEEILVLTSSKAPKDHFARIWQELPQWPQVEQNLLQNQKFLSKDRHPVKKAYSFTGDLKLYETCPRQYEFYRYLEFSPSRSAVMVFGSLVHQTIEEIHRIVLDGKLTTLTEASIRTIFERTFHFLALTDSHPIGRETKEAAFRQVMDYFNQNQEEMGRVVETEVDVSVEKEGYMLRGKVDLLMGSDGQLEVLDFKTARKPQVSPEALSSYEQQLCIYAHILQKRYGKKAERLLLYWTSEPRKDNALMEFAFKPQVIDEAGKRFDGVVQKIQAKDFCIIQAPESSICKECDVRSYCQAEGTII